MRSDDTETTTAPLPAFPFFYRYDRPDTGAYHYLPSSYVSSSRNIHTIGERQLLRPPRSIDRRGERGEKKVEEEEEEEEEEETIRFET